MIWECFEKIHFLQHNQTASCVILEQEERPEILEIGRQQLVVFICLMKIFRTRSVMKIFRTSLTKNICWSTTTSTIR